MFMNKKKIISLLLILSFIHTNIIPSYGFSGRSLFTHKSHAQRYLDDYSRYKDIVKTPSFIQIPEELGRVVEHYKGSGDRLVIHIQDRHIDFLTQSNIARIIQNINKAYNIHMICLEGAVNELDTSFYDNFEDSAPKQKVTEFFLRKGLFTGPEFFKITNKGIYLRAVGVEDGSLYLEHLQSYKKNQPGKERMLLSLRAMKVSSEKLKSLLYSDSLKTLDRAMASYQNHEMLLAQYLLVLEKYAQASSVDTLQYQDFAAFMELIRKEQSVDFKKAQIERNALIKDLSETLDKEIVQQLLHMSLDFRLDKISSVAFHEYLVSLLQLPAAGFKLSEYRNLAAYIDYIRFSQGINHLNVFEQAEELEDKTMSALCEGLVQKELVQYSRAINMLYDLFSLKLTPKKIEYIKNNPHFFDIRNIERFIQKTSNAYGIGLNLPAYSASLSSEAIGNAHAFYRLAINRDRALAENTIKSMRQYHTNKAVLVAGGFHTQGITDILQAEGISYVVICPTIGLDDCDETYAARMSGRLSDILDIKPFLLQTLAPPSLVPGGLNDSRGHNNSEEAQNLFAFLLKYPDRIPIVFPEATGHKSASAGQDLVAPAELNAEQEKIDKDTAEMAVLQHTIDKAHARSKSAVGERVIAYISKHVDDPVHYIICLEDLSTKFYTETMREVEDIVNKYTDIRIQIAESLKDRLHGKAYERAALLVEKNQKQLNAAISEYIQPQHPDTILGISQREFVESLTAYIAAKSRKGAQEIFTSIKLYRGISDMALDDAMGVLRQGDRARTLTSLTGEKTSQSWGLLDGGMLSATTRPDSARMYALFTYFGERDYGKDNSIFGKLKAVFRNTPKHIAMLFKRWAYDITGYSIGQPSMARLYGTPQGMVAVLEDVQGINPDARVHMVYRGYVGEHKVVWRSPRFTHYLFSWGTGQELTIKGDVAGIDGVELHIQGLTPEQNQEILSRHLSYTKSSSAGSAGSQGRPAETIVKQQTALSLSDIPHLRSSLNEQVLQSAAIKSIYEKLGIIINREYNRYAGGIEAFVMQEPTRDFRMQNTIDRYQDAAGLIQQLNGRGIYLAHAPPGWALSYPISGTIKNSTYIIIPLGSGPELIYSEIRTTFTSKAPQSATSLIERTKQILNRILQKLDLARVRYRARQDRVWTGSDKPVSDIVDAYKGLEEDRFVVFNIKQINEIGPMRFKIYVDNRSRLLYYSDNARFTQFIDNYEDGVEFPWVHISAIKAFQEFVYRLNRALAEAGFSDDEISRAPFIPITSLLRTMQSQQRLVARGLQAAAPGESAHERGKAIDISLRHFIKVLRAGKQDFVKTNAIKGIPEQVSLRQYEIIASINRLARAIAADMAREQTVNVIAEYGSFLRFWDRPTLHFGVNAQARTYSKQVDVHQGIPKTSSSGEALLYDYYLKSLGIDKTKGDRTQDGNYLILGLNAYNANLNLLFEAFHFRVYHDDISFKLIFEGERPVALILDPSNVPDTVLPKDVPIACILLSDIDDAGQIKDDADNLKEYLGTLGRGLYFIDIGKEEGSGEFLKTLSSQTGPDMALFPGSFKIDFTSRAITESAYPLIKQGDSVLVVGCGSGLDVIAAALRGASRVDAIDVSNIAVQNTLFNAQRWGLQKQVQAKLHKGLAGLGRYDVIIFNAPLIEMRPRYRFDSGNRVAVEDLNGEISEDFLKNLHNHLNADGMAVYSNEYGDNAKAFLDETFLRYGLDSEIIWARELKKDKRFGHEVIRIDTMHAVFKVSVAKPSSSGIISRLRQRAVSRYLQRHNISDDEIRNIRSKTNALQQQGFKIVGGLDEPITRYSVDNYLLLLRSIGMGYMVLFDNVYGPFRDDALAFRHVSKTSQYIDYMVDKGMLDLRVTAIDIGCGSGIQTIALMRKLAGLNPGKKQRVIIHAVDIQRNAVDNTLANVKIMFPEARIESSNTEPALYKITFPQGSVCESLELRIAQVAPDAPFAFEGALGSYNLVTANLPNISTGDSIEKYTLEMLKANDGMSVEQARDIINQTYSDVRLIREMLTQISYKLSKNGLACIGLLRPDYYAVNESSWSVIPSTLRDVDEAVQPGDLLITDHEERVILPFMSTVWDSKSSSAGTAARPLDDIKPEDIEQPLPSADLSAYEKDIAALIYNNMMNAYTNIRSESYLYGAYSSDNVDDREEHQVNPYFYPLSFAKIFLHGIDQSMPLMAQKRCFDYVLKLMHQDQWKHVFWDVYLSYKERGPHSWFYADTDLLSQHLNGILPIGRTKTINRDNDELRTSILEYVSDHVLNGKRHYDEKERNDFRKAQKERNAWIAEARPIYATPNDMVRAMQKLHAIAGRSLKYTVIVDDLSQPRAYDVQNVQRPLHFPSADRLNVLMQLFAARVTTNTEFLAQHPIVQASEIFLRIMDMQYFPDGNRRLARLMLNYHLMLNGYPKMFVDDEEKYLNVIRFMRVPEELAAYIVEGYMKHYKNGVWDIRAFAKISAEKVSSAGHEIILAADAINGLDNTADNQMQAIIDRAVLLPYSHAFITHVSHFTERDKIRLRKLAEIGTFHIVVTDPNAEIELKECGFIQNKNMFTLESALGNVPDYWEDMVQGEKIAITADALRGRYKSIVTVTNDIIAGEVAHFAGNIIRQDGRMGRVIIASMEGASSQVKIGEDIIDQGQISFIDTALYGMQEFLYNRSLQNVFALPPLPPIDRPADIISKIQERARISREVSVAA
jgi:methylase of polypeptide subunit release factors